MRCTAKIAVLGYRAVFSEFNALHVIAIDVRTQARVVTHDKIPGRPDLSRRVHDAPVPEPGAEYAEQRPPPGVEHLRSRPKEKQIHTLPDGAKSAVGETVWAGTGVHKGSGIREGYRELASSLTSSGLRFRDLGSLAPCVSVTQGRRWFVALNVSV